METVNVKIIYSSQEPPSFNEIVFELTKTFEFRKLPKITPCSIIIRDDAIKYIEFNKHNVEYDPFFDEYYVTQLTCEGVNRYYHGNGEEIMLKIIKDKYEPNGWAYRRIRGKENS